MRINRKTAMPYRYIFLTVIIASNGCFATELLENINYCGGGVAYIENSLKEQGTAWHIEAHSQAHGDSTFRFSFEQSKYETNSMYKITAEVNGPIDAGVFGSLGLGLCGGNHGGTWSIGPVCGFGSYFEDTPYLSSTTFSVWVSAFAGIGQIENTWSTYVDGQVSVQLLFGF